ncbi:uncharacterized protein LOC115076773 isoform X1 [Rhinatrema bivittatum]|uniref:uncharacterized protein LOC115076773 isoform X1 n=1 Tax=Rhinatrema bivittatum TaxID=194408 RepID=UPI0011294536|nr:uncharacterized protein LOC115076773 isoform X1 [Rhinatrema bivittatum]
MACARETRSWDLLLLLCVLRVGAEEQQTEVVGTVGESAVLHCFFKLPPNFPLDRLRVYWQTPDDKVVYALLSGANGDEFQASEYQGRARLWQEKLQEGDFSLLLSNLRLDDSQTYRCIVLMNETKFEMKDQSSITLSVGASYRQPNQSSPELSEVEFGEEVTFNCSSSKGYPEPKVHWTDAFKSSLPPHSVSFERDLDHFSVFSMLRLNATSDLNLSCIIENQLLQENVTARQYPLPTPHHGPLLDLFLWHLHLSWLTPPRGPLPGLPPTQDRSTASPHRGQLPNLRHLQVSHQGQGSLPPPLRGSLPDLRPPCTLQRLRIITCSLFLSLAPETGSRLSTPAPQAFYCCCTIKLLFLCPSVSEQAYHCESLQGSALWEVSFSHSDQGPTSSCQNHNSQLLKCLSINYKIYADDIQFVVPSKSSWSDTLAFVSL